MWPFLNNVTTTCGCTHCTPSTSICYSGANLPNTGIQNNDTISVALQKIDNEFNSVTTTTTTTVAPPLYKVYTALLSQSGVSAPTAIVLENTLGTITFTYTGIGQYQINSAGLFTLDKTLLFIQGSSDGDINSAYILDKLYYNTSSIINCITSGVTNGMLNKTSIEIRVYN